MLRQAQVWSIAPRLLSAGEVDGDVGGVGGVGQQQVGAGDDVCRPASAPLAGVKVDGVNMLPYLQWSVSHPQDSEDPTVSPVPSSVNGTVQLLVYNNASYAITVRIAVLPNP